MTFDVVDLYAGLGGLGIGFQQAGYNSRGAVDHWAHAMVENARIMGHETRVMPVKDADAFVAEVGWEADNGVLVGGPPCQGFSLANQGRSRTTRRATGAVPQSSAAELREEVNHFCDRIMTLQPRAFVMENVGAIPTGIIAPRIKGYHILHRKLNAANFGVPQHRNRGVFIGLRLEKGLDIEDWDPWPEPSHFDFAKLHAGVNSRRGLFEEGEILDASDWKTRYFEMADDPDPSLESRIPAVTVKDAIGDLPELQSGQSSTVPNHVAGRVDDNTRRALACIPPGGNIAHVFEKAPDTLTPKTRGKIEKKLKTNPDALHQEVWYQYKRMNWASCPAPAIPCEIRAGNGYAHPTQHRAITVREAARLQTFSDDVVLSGKRTDQYRLIGNAVPPKLSEAIATSLLESLNAL